ncbi:MAG: adenylyl-sulfate kinase [Candidatus Izemoplasma sp.]|nr:adenylyl-sulfate kinase [Candidatus Izemoplasma sp.]
MGHIIFIEGNPGSGKTTYAKRLKTTLENKGYKVKQYQEGDLHPIDLAWCAIVDESTYVDILNRYPMLENDIKQYTKHIDDN